MTITRIGVGPRMSQAVIHGSMVYLAGQVANTAKGKSVGEQTKDILSQIDALPAEPAAGATTGKNPAEVLDRLDALLNAADFRCIELHATATALIKQQWGTNLKKYSGIALPGNITFNGQQIYDEATKEIEDIEEKMQLSFEEPPRFLVG